MKTKGCGEVAPLGGVGWEVLNALLPAVQSAAPCRKRNCLQIWQAGAAVCSETSPWVVIVTFNAVPAISTAVAPGSLYVVPCWTVMLACPLRTTLGWGGEVGLGAWVVGAAPAEAPGGHVNIAVAQDHM